MKDYLAKNLKQDEKKEQYLFDNYDPVQLERIYDTQYKVAQFMKRNKMKNVYQILIVIDDFADDPSFTRNSKLLHRLYIRGRHIFISTVTATQVYKAISPVIRKNITDIYIFRLRNHADMEAWLEEMSALCDKDTLVKLYRIRTDKPFGFLYINAVAKSKQDMFYDSMQKKLVVKDTYDED